MGLFFVEVGFREVLGGCCGVLWKVDRWGYVLLVDFYFWYLLWGCWFYVFWLDVDGLLRYV